MDFRQPLPFQLLVVLLVFSGHWKVLAAGTSFSYGSHFTLAFPQLNASGVTNPYRIHVSDVAFGVSRNVDLNGHLSSPQLSQGPALGSGEGYVQDIDAGFVSSGSAPQSLAVSVTSVTGDVSVYVIPQVSGDAFTAFPEAALGSEYHCVTSCQGSQSLCQINVVCPANVSSVSVSVTLPPDLRASVTFNGASFAAGGVITHVLATYESLQIQSAADLTGTRVKASGPVVVLAGAVSTHVGHDVTAVNSLVEQMPPLTAWGRGFVAVRSPSVAGVEQENYFRLLACKPGTVVRITGENSFALNGGQWVQRNLSADAPRFIWASEPLLVVRFSSRQRVSPSSHLPAMVVLVPVEQFPSTPVLLSAANSTVHQTLTIVTSNESLAHGALAVVDRFKDSLTVNGTTLTSLTSWVEVNDTNYVVAHVKLTQDYNLVKSTMSNAPFVVYVYRGVEGQAFIGAMKFDDINPPCESTTALPGDRTDNDCDGLVDEDAACTGAPNEDCGFPTNTGPRDLLGRHFVALVPNLKWRYMPSFYALLATDSANPVTVTYSGGQTSGSVTINATSGYSLAFPVALQVNETSRSNDTLVLTSSDDVSLYLAGVQTTTETKMAASRVMPVDGLGTEYFAATLCFYGFCQVSMVAAFPATTVRIRLRFSNISALLDYDGSTYKHRDLLVVTLAQYEALHLAMEKVDMTGSHVTSDKPIAVFGAGSHTPNIQQGFWTSGSKDALWEQLIPVQALGGTFIVYNTPDRPSSSNACLLSKCGDVIRIVATEENTEVIVNGVPEVTLTHAGSFHETAIVDPSVAPVLWVNSSHPVLLVQLPEGDVFYSPAMQVVPSALQFTSWDVVRLASFNMDKMFLVLITNNATYPFIEHAGASSVLWQKHGDDTLVGELLLNTDATYTINRGGNSQGTFWGYLYGSVESLTPGAFLVPLNFLLEDLEMRCKLTAMTPGDDRDNDCDGRTDEENCDDDTSLDDDYDGIENEDCALMSIMTSSMESTPILTSSDVLPESSTASYSLIEESSYSLLVTSSIVEQVESTSLPSSTDVATGSMLTSSPDVSVLASYPSSGSESTAVGSSTIVDLSTPVTVLSSQSLSSSTVESTSVLIASTSVAMETSLADVTSSSVAEVTSMTSSSLEASMTDTAGAPSVSSSSLGVVSSELTTALPSSTLSSLTSRAPSCSCGCVLSTSMAAASLTQAVESIVRELTVDKSSISATRRSKESAPDERVSAKTVGYFGVAIISAVFCGILVLDAASLIRDGKQLVSNLKNCFRRE